MKNPTLTKALAGLAALALPLTAVVAASGPALAATSRTSALSAPLIAAQAAEWAASTSYTAGTRVTYNGVEYECIQSHTALPGWEPPNVPALWKQVSGDDGGGPGDGGDDGGDDNGGGDDGDGGDGGGPGDGDDSGTKVLGYFVNWGVYQRNYHVKNIDTSGSAAKLTHINYAFGNVTNGQCAIGDSYADYDRFYQADESVDGVADTWDQDALRGSFNQLRKLKQKYPHIKVLYSFGGWSWSGGFGQAAQNPAAFAESCYRLVEDPRWADVFDGIDIDWEYPNACGETCDSSGPDAFRNLMRALRERFGPDYLVTAAITADGTDGGKIDAADYAGAAQYVDWYNVMTYDYFGAFSPQGPTAPHSPLTSYPGIPTQGFYADAAVQKLKSKGVPASKLLLGIGFYGRGWAGVTQQEPGGTATGPAPGTHEQGIEDYKVLKTRCPATGTVGGTAYAFCGDQWWSYDTPATIGGKMSYTKDQGLGGAFFWELSGDTTDAELLTAMRNGLS